MTAIDEPTAFENKIRLEISLFEKTPQFCLPLSNGSGIRWYNIRKGHEKA